MTQQVSRCALTPRNRSRTTRRIANESARCWRAVRAGRARRTTRSSFPVTRTCGVSARITRNSSKPSAVERGTATANAVTGGCWCRSRGQGRKGWLIPWRICSRRTGRSSSTWCVFRNSRSTTPWWPLRSNKQTRPLSFRSTIRTSRGNRGPLFSTVRVGLLPFRQTIISSADAWTCMRFTTARFIRVAATGGWRTGEMELFRAFRTC